MFSGIRHSYALLRAGRTLAAYDALMTPEQISQLPWAARLGLSVAKFGTRKPQKDGEKAVAAALSSLGPSYIKLGQFLATRPDLVGPRRAFELKALQDRLPPFPTHTAEQIVRDNLGAPVDVLFTEFGPPIAAASMPKCTRREARTAANLLSRFCAQAWESGSLLILAASILLPASWSVSVQRDAG